MNPLLPARIALALAGAALLPVAQATILIDDFSSGPAVLVMHANQNPDAISATQEHAGSMASGYRQ